MSILKIPVPNIGMFATEVSLTTKNAQLSVTSVALQTGGTAYTTPGTLGAAVTLSAQSTIPATNFCKVVVGSAHGLAVGDLFQFAGITGVTGGINLITSVIYGLDTSAPTTTFYAYCTLNTGTPAGTIVLNPVHLPGYSLGLATMPVIPQIITGFTGFAYILGATNSMRYTWARNQASAAIMTIANSNPAADGSAVSMASVNIFPNAFFDGLGQCILLGSASGAATAYGMIY